MKHFLWKLPLWVDRWRVWPRAMITVYLWLLIETAFWFMGLPMPNPAQSAFASAVIGIGAGWFMIYSKKPDAPNKPLPDNNTDYLDNETKG